MVCGDTFLRLGCGYCMGNQCGPALGAHPGGNPNLIRQGAAYSLGNFVISKQSKAWWLGQAMQRHNASVSPDVAQRRKEKRSGDAHPLNQHTALNRTRHGQNRRALTIMVGFPLPLDRHFETTHFEPFRHRHPQPP